MHDNARPHVARICRQFLNRNNINILPWPAVSPDMNPIEHIWDYLGRKVRDRGNVHNLRNLFSLNIFILHRLRNKFLQLILISLDSASWELHQYSRRMCGPMKNPKVETRSRDSNSGPHDCKVDALPHDHGHHKIWKTP